MEVGKTWLTCQKETEGWERIWLWCSHLAYFSGFLPVLPMVLPCLCPRSQSHPPSKAICLNTSNGSQLALDLRAKFINMLWGYTESSVSWSCSLLQPHLWLLLVVCGHIVCAHICASGHIGIYFFALTHSSSACFQSPAICTCYFINAEDLLPYSPALFNIIMITLSKLVSITTFLKRHNLNRFMFPFLAPRASWIYLHHRTSSHHIDRIYLFAVLPLAICGVLIISSALHEALCMHWPIKFLH